MSSVTEVAVPTSDFDGNAPANGSRDMASTFSESLYWRRSARRYELLGLVSWLVWVAGATGTRAMPGISLSGPFTRR